MAVDQAGRLRKLAHELRVVPGTKVTLPRDFDPKHTAGIVREADAVPHWKRA